MKTFFGVLLDLIILLFTWPILLIRTLCNKPDKKDFDVVEEPDLDVDTIAKHLSEAVQIPTISMVEEFVDNKQAFYDFHAWLEKTYPEIHKVAEKNLINGFSLCYYIKGTDPSLKPGIFLSHQDVVPAPADGWDYPPFSGKITEDGFVYGRGSQDMKSHMICLLEAIEKKLKEGGSYKRDIYLCFGHDEEPGTSFEGAKYICEFLQNRGIKAEFVIDEGGAVVDGKMMGVPHSLALIGATEKGNGDLELKVERFGGHASNPKPPTADAVLGKAIYKLEKSPMPSKWTNLTKVTAKELAKNCGGSALGGVFKFALTNRDVLPHLVKFVFTLASPMTNALVRTTFATTMLWGAKARNVIPGEARANINYRMLTTDSYEDVEKHIKKKLGPEVQVTSIANSPSSPEADVTAPAYKNLEKSIYESFDDIVVAPYMFIAASDARFYYPLTHDIFRFDPFVYDLEDQRRIHGINERCSKENLRKGTKFFIVCLENMCN